MYQQYQNTWQPTTPMRNGLGIAALILGIVGILFSFVPLTGFIAIILGVIGLILGLVAINRVRHKQANNKVMSIIGSVLSVIAIIVGIIGIVIVNNAVNDLGDSIDNINAAEQVTIKATATGPATVSYDDNGQHVVGQSFTGSFQKQVQMDNIFGTLEVSSMSNSETVTCELIQNGVTVAKQTASGPFALVMCTLPSR